MSTTRRIIILTWIVAVAFASVGMGEVRLFLVPQGEDPTADPVGPTEFIVRPRDTIKFDIYIASDDPITIASLVIVLPKTPSCDKSAFGSVGFAGASIDGNRSDYVFPRPGIADFLPGLQQETVRYPGLARFPEGETITEPRYCSDITYTFGSDACGSFVVAFVLPPSDSEFVSVVFGPNGEPIAFSATSTVFRLSQDGDTNRDGLVDILDIFCVLDAFAGKFVNCSFEDADLSSCLSLRGNGIIDMSDIFAVIDEFRGSDSCIPPCGTPHCPP